MSARRGWGGESSVSWRRQVEELTALLVALADTAVEHQASLVGDDPVPTTLAEARERLSASTEAYRDLGGLVDRDVRRPGSGGHLQQAE